MHCLGMPPWGGEEDGRMGEEIIVRAFAILHRPSAYCSGAFEKFDLTLPTENKTEKSLKNSFE